MSKVKVVFAVGRDNYDDNLAFGYQQGLPWGHCREDLANFKKETKDSVLIMGANTFTSLPGKLPDRIHCVLSGSGQRINTKNGETADYVIHGGGLSNAIDVMKNTHNLDVCIIGGKSIIMEAMDNDLVDEAIITHIYGHTSFNAPAFKRDVSFDISEYTNMVLRYNFADFESTHITNERINKIVVEKWVKK